MKLVRTYSRFGAAFFSAVAFTQVGPRAAGGERIDFTDARPSSSERKAKQSIVELVERVTNPGSPAR